MQVMGLRKHLSLQKLFEKIKDKYSGKWWLTMSIIDNTNCPYLVDATGFQLNTGEDTWRLQVFHPSISESPQIRT